jgi:UDP-N-acetylmuramoyl-tripeptide--D-alanyl-D-alanine ligase
MMSLAQFAQLLGLSYQGPEAHVTGVSIDSRSLQPGEVFVALKGERMDGHDYIAAAQAAGAVAVLVDRPVESRVPVLQVSDTLKAFWTLAAAWRDQCSAQRIGITGSCGKTSTRGLLASILSCAGPTLASEKSFNNHIGVPLTLLKIRPEHQYAILEIGTNHPGEIAALTHLVKPTVAMITNAGPSHLEGLGSVEGVAREKADIYTQLLPNQTAIINADDAFADYWQTVVNKTSAQTVRFGLSTEADVRAIDLREHAGQTQFDLVYGHDDPLVQTIHLPLLGRHNVTNALAAAAAALALNISLIDIERGLAKAQPEARRLVRQTGLAQAAIIDDSYNANPSSVAAAISVLAHCRGERVLVLGDMLELGDQSAHYHREVGQLAKAMGIDHLFVLGPASVETAQAFGSGARHFEDSSALIAAVRPLLHANMTVLVKGSNAMGMNRVALALMQE